MPHLRYIIDIPQTINSSTKQMANLVKLSPILRHTLKDVRTKYSLLKLMDAGEYIVGICSATIFRYNVHSDEWTFVMKLPDLVQNEYGGSGLDRWSMFFIEKELQQLFISCYGTRMMVIDLKNGSTVG